MPGWIQDPITHKLIPREEYVRPKERGHFVQGDVQSFVSPVDGSVITDRKQLREHNKRNGVVNYHEFDGHKVERKQESARERKQAIYEQIIRAERQ